MKIGFICSTCKYYLTLQYSCQNAVQTNKCYSSLSNYYKSVILMKIINYPHHYDVVITEISQFLLQRYINNHTFFKYSCNRI